MALIQLQPFPGQDSSPSHLRSVTWFVKIACRPQAEPAPAPAPRLSKAAARKAAQVARAKAARAVRSDVLASLSASALPAEQAVLLRGSASRGQRPTKKQRLRRELQAQRLGVHLEVGRHKLRVTRPWMTQPAGWTRRRGERPSMWQCRAALGAAGCVTSHTGTQYAFRWVQQMRSPRNQRQSFQLQDDDTPGGSRLEVTRSVPAEAAGDCGSDSDGAAAWRPPNSEGRSQGGASASTRGWEQEEQDSGSDCGDEDEESEDEPRQVPLSGVMTQRARAGLCPTALPS